MSKTILMEQTADLFIAENPEEAVLLMTGSVNKETNSGIRYLILDQGNTGPYHENNTPAYPTTA